MTSHVPLPPDLQRFVRDQLAFGRFRSESEVIRAALHLLEGQAASHESAGLRYELDSHQEFRGRPTVTAATRSWDGLREGLSADRASGGETAATPSVRRSPRGLLADLRSDIGPDEIREARTEMWAGLAQGGS